MNKNLFGIVKMGNFLVKCIHGKTDVNSNGIPDNMEVQQIIEAYVKKMKEKNDKKILKKILK